MSPSVQIAAADIDKAVRHLIEVCRISLWFYANELPLTAVPLQSPVSAARRCPKD